MSLPVASSSVCSIRMPVNPVGDGPIVGCWLGAALLAPVVTLGFSLIYRVTGRWRLASPESGKDVQTLTLLADGEVLIDGIAPAALAPGTLLTPNLVRFSLDDCSGSRRAYWSCKGATDSATWRRLRVWWRHAPRADALPSRMPNW